MKQRRQVISNKEENPQRKKIQGLGKGLLVPWM